MISDLCILKVWQLCRDIWSEPHTQSSWFTVSSVYLLNWVFAQDTLLLYDNVFLDKKHQPKCNCRPSIYIHINIFGLLKKHILLYCLLCPYIMLWERPVSGWTHWNHVFYRLIGEIMVDLHQQSPICWGNRMFSDVLWCEDPLVTGVFQWFTIS